MILVTGGAGFIGSNLVKRLNELGETDIYICDDLGSDDKYKNLIDLKFKDIIPSRGLFYAEGLFKKFNYVYHLGACSSTTEKDCDYLIENNYEFSKKIFLLSLDNSCRFIYASSAATYGDGSAGMSDTEEDLYKFKPLNMYGYSKHLFDLFLQNNNYLNQVIGLKYFNVFGPRECHKGNMRSVINKAVEEISKTSSLVLFKSNTPKFKDGEQKRDFLYVKDAVDMTIHLAQSSEHGIFNIGSGQCHTWNYLAECVFDALDLPLEIRYVDIPKSISKNYQNYTKADITKIKKAGYEKSITQLRDAVKEYVKYLR